MNLLLTAGLEVSQLLAVLDGLWMLVTMRKTKKGGPPNGGSRVGRMEHKSEPCVRMVGELAILHRVHQRQLLPTLIAVSYMRVEELGLLLGQVVL